MRYIGIVLNGNQVAIFVLITQNKVVEVRGYVRTEETLDNKAELIVGRDLADRNSEVGSCTLEFDDDGLVAEGEFAESFVGGHH